MNKISSWSSTRLVQKQMKPYKLAKQLDCFPKSGGVLNRRGFYREVANELDHGGCAKVLQVEKKGQEFQTWHESLVSPCHRPFVDTEGGG